VITDSQAFAEVSKLTPDHIWLTSFSILMARYKGVLEGAVHCAKAIDTIKDGAGILISEGCTHHRQCEDIGTVKIPRWIEQRTGAKPEYEFTAGGGFPSDLSAFKLIIHCGGCMQPPREMRYRYRAAHEAGVPMTNYGIVISHMQGILERCIAPFGGFL
jgi:predicted GTPase